MSGFLGWLKSNVIIVVLGILTVVPLPVAWFVAGGMNSKLREERQSEATKALRDVESSTVTYTLPVLSEGEEPVSESGPPNAAKTEFYRAERAKREAMLATVRERASAFNDKGRGVLVEGLFPQPASKAAEQLLVFDMAKRVQATGGDALVSAYDELFRSLRVRPALDAEVLRDQIAARKSALMAQIAPGIAENEIEASAREQIEQRLVEQRLGTLETHARDTSFYGDASMLPPAVPTTVPTVAPTLEICFNWQADYWLVAEVLTALASANDRFDTRGVGGNVLDGVVKRVEAIRFEPMVSAAAIAQAQFQGSEVDEAPVELGGHGRPVAGSDREFRSPSPRSPAGGNAGQPLVLSESFTGRKPGESELFDLRIVEVTLVASYEKLPELINAISSSNFMTVLDADVYAVDPWDMIAQGHYAGADYPVRVELEIETLWLRSWTKQFMPPKVRGALNIPEETATEEGPA